MAFVINNIAYMGGGFSGLPGTMKDFWKYDPSMDQRGAKIVVAQNRFLYSAYMISSGCFR